MQEIKDLIRAHHDLLVAQENLPSNVSEAAKRLSERTGVNYIESLEIIGDAVSTDGAINQATKQVTVKRRGKGNYGGQVNPKGLADIKKRVGKTTGTKQECYKAVYELFKHKGEWVSGKDLTSLGINIKNLNRRSLTACLPAGFVFQSSAHGYKACDLSKVLT